MITALKAALSGPLETVILGLMKSTAQYDATEIRGSMKVNLHHTRHFSTFLLCHLPCPEPGKIGRAHV